MSRDIRKSSEGFRQDLSRIWDGMAIGSSGYKARGNSFVPKPYWKHHKSSREERVGIRESRGQSKIGRSSVVEKLSSLKLQILR